VKHVIRPAARADILDQFRYLLEREAHTAAERFLEATEETIARICSMPKGGAPKNLPHPSLKGLRSWPVSGFDDIRVYYLATGSQVRVVRVLHGKRDVAPILEDAQDQS
jgi:plasmid stabilization system protein ParE